MQKTTRHQSLKYVAMLLLSLAIAGCGETGDSPNAENTHTGVAPDVTPPADNSLPATSTPDKQPAPGNGWIGVIVPSNAVDILANTPGVLTVSARPGDVVSQGDIVARVDNFSAQDDLEIAELQLRALEAELEQAEFNARQEQSLYDRRIAYPDAISKDELDRAESSAKAAQAKWKAAQAALEEQRIRVEQNKDGIKSQAIGAPFAGTVELNYLDSGAAIKAGTPVMKISTRDAFKIRFAVEPDQAGSLHIGDRIQVFAGETSIAAEVMSIAPFVDIPSQTVFVEAFPLEQSRLLRSGLSVTVAPAERNLELAGVD